MNETGGREATICEPERFWRRCDLCGDELFAPHLRLAGWENGQSDVCFPCARAIAKALERQEAKT